MSDDHGHEMPFDPAAGFHPSCVADLDRPRVDAEWQRRACGLAVALSEFGHYAWSDFQQQLIDASGRWEDAPADERGRWAYYEHWVTALDRLVRDRGMLGDDYVVPERSIVGP